MGFFIQAAGCLIWVLGSLLGVWVPSDQMLGCPCAQTPGSINQSMNWSLRFLTEEPGFFTWGSSLGHHPDAEVPPGCRGPHSGCPPLQPRHGGPSTGH